MNEIFDFLPGGVIVHKIARLNKRLRHALTKLKPFGATRVIKLKIDSSGFKKCKKWGNYVSLFINDKSTRGDEGLDLRVIKKFLGFSNNISLEINDNNFEHAAQVIDVINSFAPEKKIHLLHDTRYVLPNDIQIFSCDFKKMPKKIDLAPKPLNLSVLIVRN